jgi:twitching motility protein PilT
MNSNFEILRYLRTAEEESASDIHFKSGSHVYFRLADGLRLGGGDCLSNDQIMEILGPCFEGKKERVMELYKNDGSADFSYETDQVRADKLTSRYRIQMFKSSGKVSCSMRRINPEVPSYKEINLPDVYGEILYLRPKGIIILGGETGSGKSTTLASLIDQINSTSRKHIVTIKDPVEYVFTSKQSLINQRELGEDYVDFKKALKAIVREDPDIILVGEMRDIDTVRGAISSAETGHLVLTTLHTATATATLDRILNFFPEDEKPGIRSNLSNNLIAILNQMLLPTTDNKGRVPATEVLINNASIREYILDPKEQKKISGVIDDRADGMHSFNHSLFDLYKAERIIKKVAIESSPNRDALEAMIRGVNK